MILRQPTDFLVLRALSAHGRNVATNLAELTGKSRKNINTRLPVLADYGLVEKVGPADHSGLYEITDLGERALAHADRYDDVDDFEALLEAEAGGRDVSPADCRDRLDAARADGDANDDGSEAE